MGADAIFYGDNTEFRNPFREGETIFGAAARLDATLEISSTVSLEAGFLGNRRFGSERPFDLARPILALRVTGRRSTFVIGTLPASWRADDAAPGPRGPDTTGPHGLVPPLQRETLAFERPYEAGLLWTYTHPRVEHESWLQWQRLNTAESRERLDAGFRGGWRGGPRLAVPIQAHIVHEGGQLFASGPVRDSVAVASGLMLSSARVDRAGSPAVQRLAATLEVLGLWSRFTPDREAPDPSRDGAGFFARAAALRGPWRGHLIVWRGDDFFKDEGDPNYLSVRRDGRRWRGVRDYAEAGLTRAWRLAPGTRIEASFRLHRIERHYEYSYRIQAIASTRARLR